MARALLIEDESGTCSGFMHPHNGYYAGDFHRADVSMRPSGSTCQVTACARPAGSLRQRGASEVPRAGRAARRPPHDRDRLRARTPRPGRSERLLLDAAAAQPHTRTSTTEDW